MTLSINNQIALNQSWYEAADPFRQMGYRTGYATEDVFALSFEQRIEAAFGEEIASLLIKPANERKKPEDVLRKSGSHVEKALFSIWCALALRQNHKIVSPINAGDKVAIVGLSDDYTPVFAGMQFIKSFGRLQNNISYGKLYNQLFALLGGTKESSNQVINDLAKQFNLCPDAVKQAFLSYFYCIENPDVKAITSDAMRSALETIIEVPENLVFVSSHWARTFDFEATNADVWYVCKELESVLGKNPVIKVIDSEGEFTVLLDNEHEFLVTPEGVWQKSRGRRFNNILLLDKLGWTDGESRVPAEEMVLLNGFGSFLWAIINMSSKYLVNTNEMGQFVKCLVSGKDIPLVAKDEVGAGDADRVQFEKYVTVERDCYNDLPFQLIPMTFGEPALKLCYNTPTKLFEADTKRQRRDQAALRTFNLVRMPAGMFIDGRRSCVQLQHIHPQLKTAFIKLVYQDLFGISEDSAIAASAREQYKLDLTDEQVIKYLEEYLVIATSSKLAKLIKRTAMDSALVGHVKDGESRGFIRYGQEDISINNWVVEACVSAHAIFPAGVAVYWDESPTLVVDHTQGIQPNVPTPKDLKSAVVCDFANHANEPVLNNGWWEIVMRQHVPVNKDAIIGRVPYKVGEDTYYHYLINKVESAKLVSIRWKLVKAFGNSSTLKIQFVVTTDESQLKGRNNIKAMISRYYPECIHNSLNENALLARSIFFADTNKWLDLLMQHVDVAACTIVKNQDPEGLELIRQANQGTGLDTDQYLEWSPVLALLGVYKPIINWFDDKFGKAVWFRHNDGISGDWVNVLRQMYSIEPNGWKLLKNEEVSNFLPTNAVKEVAVSDGDITNDKTNILIFYIQNGEHFFIQRAWSYVGTDATGPVWQPVKAEVSSVRAIIGKTPMMAGAVRTLERSDPEFAHKLVTDRTLSHKASVFAAMLVGKTFSYKGVELPVVELGSDESKAMLRTEELQQVVNDPDAQAGLLKELAKRFNKVMFFIKSKQYSINLAAVYKQDSNESGAGDETMSAMVQNLFVKFINGVEIDNPLMQNLAARIMGALKSLCEGEGFIKSVVQCRMSAQTKTIALPGIPADTTFVRHSEQFDSLYQTMVRTFKCKNLEGKKVAISRAPLTFPSFNKLHVIYDNDMQWADIIEEYAAYISPITAIADRGDNDGDNRSFTWIEDHLQ
jgi:hypothetical protein